MNNKFQNKYRISSSRLKNWDYGKNGAYFITICTRNREHFFGEIVSVNDKNEMHFNEIGRLANVFWAEIPKHFPFVELGNYQIMPNHVHGILIIDKNNIVDDVVTETLQSDDVETLHCNVSTENGIKNEQMAKISPKPSTISTIIRSYKSVVTKNAHYIHADFEWQERFHDHIIRDSESFERIQNYIENNVANWKDDKFSINIFTELNKKPMNLKVIAFDADDTLFVNEPYFQETEQKFCGLMEDYLSHQGISQELFKVEIDNLKIYGYGIKAYILSMIEAAMKISNNTIPVEVIEKIIEYGKELLEKPIELLDGVEETLEALKGKYKLVVATKGDLLDQRRKLHDSGLGHYFHHIEVMSDKQEKDYSDLLKRLEIQPEEFFMIGNSLKSDVLPVLAIGGHAVHIPFHTTWAHERIDHTVEHENFYTFEKMTDVLKKLKK